MNRLILILTLLFLAGCESLRLAPTELQKQNALLHSRTAELAAQKANAENSSAALCNLTTLSAEQSKAFVLDTGLPKTIPSAFTEDEILSEQTSLIAQSAAEDAARRVDVWQMTDSAIDFGIAIAGLLGGAYGLKAAGYLKSAKDKSTALKEIITNNELFKKMYPQSANNFKAAQSSQSPATKQIVSQTKLQV